jgi:tRNA 2-thiocytidine biosynthesis protein TtcA
MQRPTPPTKPSATTANGQNVSFDHPLAVEIRKEMVRAICDFNMIDHGDRILVCVSGGKDSSVLLANLIEIQRRSERKFVIEAAILDQKQPGFEIRDFKNWIENLGVRFHIVERDTYSIVKEKVTDGVYCSLCSRLRRAILYDFAADHGFTKMALGHHRDDLIETTLLNMFYTGNIGSMPPKLKSDDGRNIIIRPLCYVPESNISRLALTWAFPVIPCNLCGSQEGLKRKKMKQLVRDLEKDIPAISASIIKSLSNVKPSQLLDQNLWDFKNLSRDHSPQKFES